MDPLIAFMAGLVVGANLGLLILSIFVAGKDT